MLIFSEAVSPSILAVPEVASSNPKTILMVVLLPAPFSPRIPVIPSEISKLTLLSATTPLYCFVRFSTESNDSTKTNIAHIYRRNARRPNTGFANSGPFASPSGGIFCELTRSNQSISPRKSHQLRRPAHRPISNQHQALQAAQLAHLHPM